jgi:membrane-bound acyltransferase YfiQ involved in biofilm formation
MSKRLLLLNGLAILAVVFNHASSYIYLSMFWWTTSYRQVTVPNYDQLGSAAYYGVVAIQQLTLFSVPAFLFVSGFFVAYAARGKSGGFSWKTVQGRITGLLWPFLIWSTVLLLLEVVQTGKVGTPLDYIRRLLTGDIIGAYYFVPLLCQFYLLAPLIVKIAKQHPVALLIGSAALQFGISIWLVYLQINHREFYTGLFSNGWLFIWQVFYFPLGVVVGFRWSTVRPWLARYKWILVVLAAAFGLLSIFENEWIQLAMGATPDWQAMTVSSRLYALTFILAFVAFDQDKGRIAQGLNWLGARSYGIYLLHFPLLGFGARFFHHFLPALLAQPLLLQVLLVVEAIGISTLFMKAVALSPARKWYRYLFG